ncbi:hypothetical protein D3C86_1426940 [compost metagenome]
MVLPALPVPWTSGRLSSVVPLAAMAPVTVPWSSTSLLMETSTFLVSTLMSSAEPLPLELPAGSTTSVLSECAPSPSGVVGVMLQLPSGSATAVPIFVSPSYRLTVAPGSALPLNSGLLSSVVSPLVRVPCLAPTSSRASWPVARLGGVVSITKFQTPVASLVWPTGLVAVATMLCMPPASGVSGVKLHLPEASATTSPILVPLS